MLFPPDLLLNAYVQGYFPMAFPDGEHYWYDPNPRAIMPLDARFHVTHRLARTVRQQRFDIVINRDFAAVVGHCADRDETWISDEIAAAFRELHRLGYAHSIEAWRGGALVGGLYGMALGGFFAGESMFSAERDASKVVLVELVRHLRRQQFTLFDVQFLTAHLAQFGAYEIPRSEYKRRLRRAIQQTRWFV
ncbi:MAG: leucyl/phenylalanyl-tRNA--protein transferase [Anaerolineales bacterium]|nr:leucyl/phenylalanyl-tRNA--protein transferase [Anaerolineales bacterium]MCB9129139.1 leucyl/phenylalanyl-tRNA--protein transferase [Ardenticatenales bacterium]